MTRTPEVLSPDYDAPTRLPESLEWYEKRKYALAALNRAEAAGDADITKLMFWELGLIDFGLANADGVSPFGGGDFDQYAAHFHLEPETAQYARERGSETNDIILRLHYLEYALARMAPKGRQWIDLQREVLAEYREYIDGCRANAASRDDEVVGVRIADGLRAVGRLLNRPGLVPDTSAAEWAGWLLQLAADSRGFPTRDPRMIDQQRNRWVASYLKYLATLPATAASSELRSAALKMLDEAAVYYASAPLNDDFERKVAEVEAVLRKHWGEEGTHERMIRRQFEATVRRAEFHRGTGNGLLTATFFREARKILETDRQYFGPADVSRLQVAEQAALERAVERGEFGRIHIPMEIPMDDLDHSLDSAVDTVQALFEHVIRSVPDRAALAEEVDRNSSDAPLRGMLARTIISAGKVVGESRDETDNRALDIEQGAMIHGRLIGASVAITVERAGAKAQLSASDLVNPLLGLDLDAGTVAMIASGCDRFIAGDHISALHTLVPRVEDALRQRLKALGVDTTDFRRDVGDGTSRTDDATLGSLMRKTFSDGRSVKDYLGSDVWEHIDSVLNSQTGLNLRNNVAHGLARPHHCSPENVGITLSLLYLIADADARWSTTSKSPSSSDRTGPAET